MRTMLGFVSLAVGVGLAALTGTPAQAACTFTTVGTTMNLDADCTTDTTIFVPDGYTLNGQGNAITAVDPAAGHFVGGVIENGGTVAHVTRLVVNTSGLTNVCDGGGDRLRGIMFDGASGSITQSTVENINQGASGCQEGNAIEVRNAPFDGTHTDTQTVEIAHNVISDWQKTGIVCNGDVECHIHHNFVGESATQANLAANSVQVGFGAKGMVELNHIAGNQWQGLSCFAASAVLVFSADSTTIRRNNIGGNSEVGLFFFTDMVTADNNRIFDGGVDLPLDGHDCVPDVLKTPDTSFDIGICDVGIGNNYSNNKIRGFDDPVGVNSGCGAVAGQKLIPSPAEPEVCFGTDCKG